MNYKICKYWHSLAIFNNSAELRTPRALAPHVIHALNALLPYMPRATRVLVPHVPCSPPTLVPDVLLWHTYITPYVLTSQVSYVLRAPVSHVLRAKRVVVPDAFRGQRALAPCVLSVLRTLVSHLPRVLHPLMSHLSCTLCVLAIPASRVSPAFCPVCPHALWSLFPCIPLVRRTSILYANTTFRALEVPCLTLLFFRSFPSCNISGEIYWS